MAELPIVTVGVIALNEEQALPNLLEQISAQDYPHEAIQVALVDSGSDDSTRTIMENFQASDHDFLEVLVLDNPGRIQPKGWNVLIGAVAGDVVMRIDAHARIPADFVSSAVAVLNEGEDVAGGPRPTIAPQDATDWQYTLLAAEDSLFGASIAKYRSNGEELEEGGEPEYVKSVFHPAYRREVIKRVGLFNENLVRTEDNDYSYRIREAGYKIRFDPRIHSEQIIRPSLKAMIKQKHGNGYWIGRTLFVQPGAVEIYHLVPAAFVAAIAGAGALALSGRKWPARALAGAYGAATAVMSVAGVATSRHKNLTMAALPAIFPILHIAYGIGTFKGIAKGLLARN